jgi:hypothetical protein
MSSGSNLEQTLLALLPNTEAHSQAETTIAIASSPTAMRMRLMSYETPSVLLIQSSLKTGVARRSQNCTWRHISATGQ